MCILLYDLKAFNYFKKLYSTSPETCSRELVAKTIGKNKQTMMLSLTGSDKKHFQNGLSIHVCA